MGGIRGLFSRKKLLIVLAGILIAATLFFFLRGVGGQLDASERVAIGIVNRDDSLYSKMLLSFYEENGLFTSYVSVYIGEEEEVQRWFEEGRLDMYLVIPENFADSMTYLEHLPVQAVISTRKPAVEIMLTNLKFILTNVLPSATRFFEFLDRAEETGDGAKNKWKKNNLFAEEADPMDIHFCNVVFHYNNIEGEKKEVLNGIHLKIREGEKLALIGRNGSGKTTLVKLLLRFYKSQDGSIFLSDREIEEIPLKEYRGLFSVVSQEIYLFNDTIRNNVCMYRDFSEDAIRAVLDEVGLSEMVSERGMDFLVGINGALLSGGQ